MKKVYFKLIAISLALTLSISLVVMSSYAWFVLSESPAVEGIQVAIGGGNTILIAPDMTQTINGITYHYPGAFSDKLNFGQHDSYDYLQSLGGLAPVSTADGINWFLPEYYDADDAAVLEGDALCGELKDVSEFTLDTFMAHANLQADAEDTIAEGSYIYLDFWVVSPGSDYTLRISTGDDSGGSFLIDMLQPAETQTEAGTSYELSAPDSKAAAAARVGFLINSTRLTDDSMLHYQNSYGFDERYTQLRGSYLDADSDISYAAPYRFVIYEPNGDYHPDSVVADGDYMPTRPVGMVDGVPTEVSVMDLVTVQKRSLWTDAATGQGAVIEQIFQTFLLGEDLADTSSAAVSDAFFNSYLQGQLAPYIDKGDFVKKSESLKTYNGLITAEQLSQLEAAGATDDVCLVELERNVPQRIRMFIWLEGQDVDCNDTVRTSSFALNIELAGSNQ